LPIIFDFGSLSKTDGTVVLFSTVADNLIDCEDCDFDETTDDALEKIIRLDVCSCNDTGGWKATVAVPRRRIDQQPIFMVVLDVTVSATARLCF
jgi:hypothetical protein